MDFVVSPQVLIEQPPPFLVWSFVQLSRNEIAPLLDNIGKYLQHAGFSKRDIFRTRLALDEAIGNAIRHGHDGDRAKPVEVFYHITPQRILAKVQDLGAGFDPDKVPDPLHVEDLGRPAGRGLLLMRSFMDRVEFNPSGNCVTMVKFRSSLGKPANTP